MWKHSRRSRPRFRSPLHNVVPAAPKQRDPTRRLPSIPIATGWKFPSAPISNVPKNPVSIKSGGPWPKSTVRNTRSHSSRNPSVGAAPADSDGAPASHTRCVSHLGAEPAGRRFLRRLSTSKIIPPGATGAVRCGACPNSTGEDPPQGVVIELIPFAWLVVA